MKLTLISLLYLLLLAGIAALMPWGKTPLAFALLVGAILATESAFLVILVRKGARQWWNETIATKLKRAEREGYLCGLNEGSRDFARFLSERDHTFYQGFAEECRKCGTAWKVVGPAREEYWVCGRCNHRQPAPAALEPQTASQP